MLFTKFPYTFNSFYEESNRYKIGIYVLSPEELGNEFALAYMLLSFLFQTTELNLFFRIDLLLNQRKCKNTSYSGISDI